MQPLPFLLSVLMLVHGPIRAHPLDCMAAAPLAGGPRSGDPRGGSCWPTTSENVIYENGDWDWVNSLASERNTVVPLASTADDFVVPEGVIWRVEGISTLHWAFFWAPPFEKADVLVYEASDMGSPPGESFLVIELLGVPVAQTETACTDHTGQNGLVNLDVTLGTPLLLPSGRYFLVVRAVGAGPDENQRAFWATTGNGTVRWDRGWFQSEYFGFPEWTPVDDPRILGAPSDFAFRLLGEVQTVPGDFDGDGDIDIADFSFFSTCFGGSGVPCAENCCAADLDSDGDVDIADFAIFSANFTGSQ